MPDRGTADLRTAFDHAPIGIAILTPTGEITAGNAALGELLHRSPAELVGTTFFEVTHPDDLPAARRSCELMQTGRTRTVRHECRFVRAGGSVVWVSLSTSRVPPVAGRPAHLIMHVEDVSERKALEARLAHLALHDPLTGLANRALLVERIDRALADGGSAPSCVLYLDLNGFKTVNDRFGHAVGDAVLQQLAARITAVAGVDDTVARLGGDEFAVLCAGSGAERGARLVEQLRSAAARPFEVEGRVIRLTAAVGLSTTGDGRHPARPADLLAAADRRMYRAKRRAAAERPCY